jgi:hypothetical protein
MALWVMSRHRDVRVMSVIPLKPDIHQRGFARPLSAISRHLFNCPDKLPFDGSGDDTED